MTTSDELANSVAGWDAEDRENLRRESEMDEKLRADVATALLTDNDLRDLLLSPKGRLWLQDDATRGASVNFLRVQQRVVQRDDLETVRRYDVFMSYAKEDRREAARIAPVLAQSKLRVFMDTDLNPGMDWQQELLRVLGTAKAVVVCIGPAGRVSGWREKELETAITCILLKCSEPLMTNMYPCSRLNIKLHFDSYGSTTCRAHRKPSTSPTDFR